MIFANENESSGMHEVMSHIHDDYVPCNNKENPTKFKAQGIAGDQLIVERGVSSLLQVENGFTNKEKLDGLHMEIADFHGGMKFLQVCIWNSVSF